MVNSFHQCILQQTDSTLTWPTIRPHRELVISNGSGPTRPDLQALATIFRRRLSWLTDGRGHVGAGINQSYLSHVDVSKRQWPLHSPNSADPEGWLQNFFWLSITQNVTSSVTESGLHIQTSSLHWHQATNVPVRIRWCEPSRKEDKCEETTSEKQQELRSRTFTSESALYTDSQHAQLESSSDAAHRDHEFYTSASLKMRFFPQQLLRCSLRNGRHVARSSFVQFVLPSTNGLR